MQIPSLLWTLVASASLWLEVHAIINGELQKTANPYVVSVVVSGWTGDSHLCGGTIIGAKTVLTAAHCTEGSSASNLRIKYGGTDRLNLSKSIAVNKITQHPSYSSSTHNEDFALLILDKAVTAPDGSPMTTYAQVSTKSPSTGTDITMSGWGKLRGEDNTLPKEIHTATLSSLEATACNEKWADINRVTKKMACAESTSKSFCKGDDGGPVMNAEGSVVFGVMSWNANGCPADSTVRPNVYSDVSLERAWIIMSIV